MGTDSRKLDISQIDSGSEIVVCAIARPRGVSVSPSVRIIPTIGTPIATGGIIRVTRAAMTNQRPVTVLNLATPYAAGTARIKDSRVLIAAVDTLLMKESTTPSRPSALS